jgi:hypothetical protein
MKQILIALVVIVSLHSCTKTITVDHDIHDTTYISQYQIKIDTFNRFSIVRDTVVIQDTHTDTVTQIKRDTLIVTTKKTDTLFKSFYDTVYLSKFIHDTVISVKTIVQKDTVFTTQIVQLHDTVSKYVYLHDTIDNFQKIFIHDTVIQINTITKVDTLTNYITANWLGYPVPAPGAGQLLYVYLDTIPGLVIHSIEFQNIFSWVPMPQMENYPYGLFTQDVTYFKFDNNPYVNDGRNLQIAVPGPMVCNIIINYDWTAETGASFRLDTFNPGPGIYSSWETHSPGGLGGSPGTVFKGQVATFQSINLPNVFQLTIAN